MSETDPLERLRMFPGSTAEQVIALTDLWRQRSKRTFVAMRERMNELEDLDTRIEPAAFDNYFRRTHRDKTPEAVVWALIRVMRDSTWLPDPQQCTLAEALYLATLKNVSVVTYARIYRLFPGQEEEFRRLCPLGDIIAERASDAADSARASAADEVPDVRPEPDKTRIVGDTAASQANLVQPPAMHWMARAALIAVSVIFVALVVWALVSSIGWAP